METILSKIGAAFDLAYQRFLDLQKAEAQTREAQIETALEKICYDLWPCTNLEASRSCCSGCRKITVTEVLFMTLVVSF